MVQKASSFGNVSLGGRLLLTGSFSMQLIMIQVLSDWLVLDYIPRNISTSIILIDSFDF
jgi:hypothetical protein